MVCFETRRMPVRLVDLGPFSNRLQILDRPPGAGLLLLGNPLSAPEMTALLRRIEGWFQHIPERRDRVELVSPELGIGSSGSATAMP